MTTNIPPPEELSLKIRELESEVSEIKLQLELSKKHAKEIATAFANVIEGASILRYYANQKNVRIDDIENAFETIGDLNELHDTCNFLEIRDQIEDYMGRLMSCVIELCGGAGISSTEALQSLRKHFDRQTLIKIVHLNDVADSYGIAEAHEWMHQLHE